LVNLKPYWAKIKKFTLIFWVDLVLGLGVAGSVWGFVYTRATLNDEGGFNNLVATLGAGDAQRRPRGSFDFQHAPVGTGFYNLDAIWVPKNASAILQTGD